MTWWAGVLVGLAVVFVAFSAVTGVQVLVELVQDWHDTRTLRHMTQLFVNDAAAGFVSCCPRSTDTNELGVGGRLDLEAFCDALRAVQDEMERRRG